MSTKKYRDAHKEETKAYSKKYLELHPDYHKEYRKNNREKIRKRGRTPNNRFHTAKAKAKHRNKEWSLSIEQYSNLIQQPCYYCDGFFGAESKYSFGLDRLDNAKGYIVDNVVSCCTVCNRTKSDHFSPEETMVAINAVIKLRKGK